MDCYLGAILLWPMDWAPQGWTFCNGQAILIAQNQALYSLLGNKFGATSTTFNLPNLCGRVPVGVGNGYDFAATGGAANTTLSISNLPSHNHTATVDTSKMACSASGSFTISATSTAGNFAKPDNNSYLAQAPKAGTTTVNIYNNNPSVQKDVQLPGGTVNVNATLTGNATATIENTGNATPVNNMQPYVVLNYIICTQGLYPSRP